MSPAAIVALAIAATNTGQQPGQAVVRAVANCGVSTAHIAQRRDAGLRETVVDVPEASLSRRRLACLAKAAETLSVRLQFASNSLQTEYEKAQAAPCKAPEAVRRSQAESRRWLRQQGLLQGALRIRTEGGSLETQARKMEAYCGFAPGAILQVRNGAVLIVAPPNVSYDQVHRLLAVMDVVVPEHMAALVGQEPR